MTSRLLEGKHQKELLELGLLQNQPVSPKDYFEVWSWKLHYHSESMKRFHIHL
jgi:hypothetical protein